MTIFATVSDLGAQVERLAMKICEGARVIVQLVGLCMQMAQIRSLTSHGGSPKPSRSAEPLSLEKYEIWSPQKKTKKKNLQTTFELSAEVSGVGYQ